MPDAIKVDTAAVDLTTRDNESWGGGQYNMDGMLPIVLASAVWGPAWHGKRIIVHCDNSGAATVTNSGYSRALRIMHLL